MSNNNDASKYISKLASNISMLRKQNNMTQEDLAEELGISFQAVSKWENNLSSPDIQFLPQLAEIFGITIDSLFSYNTDIPVSNGVKANAEILEGSSFANMFSDADVKLEKDTMYLLAVMNDKIVLNAPSGSDKEKIKIDASGCKSVVCMYNCDLYCEDISGDVTAGNNVSCSEIGGKVAAANNLTCETIRGSAAAGNNIDCTSVEGSASAGNNLECVSIGGSVSVGNNLNCVSVEGDVSAGGGITCASIDGNASVGGSVTCDTVGGDISSGGDINCDSIEGNASAGGTVTCETITGNVDTKSGVSCNVIEGNVKAEGNVTCERIEGDVKCLQGKLFTGSNEN